MQLPGISGGRELRHSMRKSIWIFLLAVLLPSVVLGWLALRSAEEQKIILERRTAELRQTEADNVAAAARSLIDEQRRAFADAVGKIIGGGDPQKLAGAFTKSLAQAWPRKAVGFAIGADGRLLSPSVPAANGSPELKKFLLDNGAFLGGSLVATVYPVPVEDLNRPEAMRKSKGVYSNAVQQQDLASNSNAAKQRAMPAAKQEIVREQSKEADVMASKMTLKDAQVIEPRSSREAIQPPGLAASPAPAPTPSDRADGAMAADQEAMRMEASVRNVQPQQNFNEAEKAQASSLWSATAGFRMLCVGRDDGMVTRFVQDRLDMIFWLRPAQAPEMIFGCLLEADSLADLWPSAMPDAEYRGSLSSGASEFVLALLDDKARPVVTRPAGVTGREWKRPFVASEIGEALPHWEAALYLMRPEQLQESARGLRRTLIFLIVGMLGAIACGGWLVVQDARLQLARAQQKTDFVSNVSHELKTPLTSIRMFAELMQNGRPETAEKAPQYLRIIMVEAERLTRLINNVLDFAKLERRQKRFEKKPLDLHAVIERTWESHELHLRESGFATRWQAASPPYPVTGDEDALAQILVNLFSNAEKYAGANKDVELHSYIDGDQVCVSVLDRGIGVPSGDERKIFEAFYRAHDSLSSGIQGSGLGLTLAQRLALEHGGEVVYSRREGGGSNFTLRLPLAKSST